MKRPGRRAAGLLEEVAELRERVERLERHQARFREDMTAQLRRSDVAYEDCVEAIELMRRRLAAIEHRERDLPR